MERLGAGYRCLLVLWVEGVRRGAWAVSVGAVLLTAVCAYYVIENISINTSTTDMLSPELEFRKQSKAVSAAFPQFSNTITVVIDGATPDLADDAALALAEALRKKPGLFGEVWDLAGAPFMRRNGLLYKETDELADLGDRLAEAQPFLGVLWKDPSIRGLFDMLIKAVDEIVEGDGNIPIEIGPVLAKIAQAAEAQAAGAFGQVSWRRLMEGEETGETRRVFLIQPAMDFGSLSLAADAMEALRETARGLGLTPENGVRVRLTGAAALAREELKSVESGMGLAGLLSLILVMGLLMVGLRSGPLVAATLVTLVMGLIWTAGFAILAIGSLNLISVAFAVLFIGLSVDFGIHFGLRYKEGVDARKGHAAALGAAAEGVGGSLTLCAVSAAVAFYSFLPTDYLGLAELGLIAGTGMFIAFFANLTVLPALLTLMPVRPGKRREEGVNAMASFIRRRARIIVGAAVVLGAVGAGFLPLAGFDFDPLNLKDPETESVSTLFDLIEDGHGPYTITVLAPNLDEARALAKRLDGLPEVDDARTLVDFVPKEQDDKLDVIGAMGMFLLPSFSAGDRKMPPTVEEMAALKKIVRGKAFRLTTLDDETLAGLGRRLYDALEKIPPEGLPELQDRLLNALPGRLSALKMSLEAGQVGLSDLPEGLVARHVAADGRARVSVHPEVDVTDRAALTLFVEAVRSVAPQATGTPVVIMEAGNTVVRAFRDAALIALCLIAVLLALILRRLREVLLVFAPILLAGLLTVAASVVLDLPFNFANVIVLPLLFGLGVAGGVHLVVRERSAETITGVLETSTPRAVMFSALTTIGSFGSIALSSHQGTASMGLLLTVAVTLTLLSTLVVLPALMALVSPGKETVS